MKFPLAVNRRTVYLVLLLVSCTLVALAMVVLPLVEESLQPAPVAGEVAARDYRAARSASYISQIRTDQRRLTAGQSVADIYTPPDTRVARRQMEQLRATLNFISSVRADGFASTGQKLDDLSALEDIRLSVTAASAVLGLSESRWQEVQQGALSVLERIMSSAIRATTLADARSRAPSLVSLSFPEDQAALVAELAAAFVAPNSEYSEALTQAARLEAIQAVEPVARAFIAGQTVVRQGQLLAPEDVEALFELGLVQAQQSWQDLLSAGLITLLMSAAVAFYYHRKQSLHTGELGKIVTISGLLVAFLALARLVIPAHTVIPYTFPLAAYGLTVTALFGLEIALVTLLPLSILAAYGLVNANELTLFFLVSSLFGALALGKARRILGFLIAGLAIGASGSAVVVVYRLPQFSTDTAGLITLAAAAFFNGLVSASLAILLHAFLAHYLGMVTPMQLVELTRPDHPLLRRLLRESPGTYQHSLQVANLAEQAAERIGADALLTRVGALYHDIGKTASPIFYIENQPSGFANPHDGLAPENSARRIIQHITDGVALARKHRLPQRVIDFITEHHGTLLTRYQYNKAVQAAGGDESRVDPEIFRYPGPRPQSRETAILMLADGCEARVRAEAPPTEEAMRRVIRAAIDDRIKSGQLDDTRLTLSDLTQIADSFFVTLRGFYHPRLDYAKAEKEMAVQVAAQAAPTPAAPSPAASSQPAASDPPAPADPAAAPASGLDIPTVPLLPPAESNG
ncbi:MAG: HD family phosphohydrolase [Chloroflexota bacterium]